MTSPDLEYLRSIELPSARARSAGEEVTPPAFVASPQVVTVASQLCEFTSSVAPSTRSTLSNCLLLAQLAADKAFGSPASDIYRWYDKYHEVLRNSGWLLADIDFREQALSVDGAFVHKEIIPVITAFLGPAATAGSLILQVLNSLNQMQQDEPWITLFQSESQSLKGGKFQMSLVDTNANGDAEARHLSVSVEASQRVTQVLFFKLRGQATRLQRAESVMTMSPTALSKAGPIASARVAEHVADYIMNVDI
jgi:hypothetical protein